jgi:hypothetical protein
MLVFLEEGIKRKGKNIFSGAEIFHRNLSVAGHFSLIFNAEDAEGKSQRTAEIL